MKKFQSFLAHRKRTKGVALSLLMAAGLFAASGSTVSAEGYAYLDLTSPVSLQVTIGTVEQIDDLKESNLVIDVYQIGKAVKNSDDSYHVELLGDFTDDILTKDLPPEADPDDPGKMVQIESINDKNISYPSWQKIASNASDALLGETPSVNPDVVQVCKAVSAFDAEGNLASIPLPANDDGTYGGLFLVVPHGSDLDEYVKILEDGSIGTIAHSDMLEYTFTPMLVAAPGKALTDENYGTFNTADPTPWMYTVFVSFKADQEPLIGRFKIVKEIDAYETTDPVTFIFQVEGTFHEGQEDEEKVISTAASIVFDGVGEESRIFENIKVGSKITVTEVYRGANYELEPGSIVITANGEPVTEDNAFVVSADEDDEENILTFRFKNYYDDTYREGGSVTNQFEHDENTWKVTPAKDR